MKAEAAKGYLFEVIVGELLQSAGYKWYSDHNGYVQGRGAKHQIDAIGLNQQNTPFVNNVRLLAEAKYLSSKVGLPIVRNSVGVLTDINESYSPKTASIARKLLGSRNTNCIVIFSNQDFTEDAINYGYAHNIYLVSYVGNPVVANVISAFEALCSQINFRKTGKSKNALKEKFASILHNEGRREFMAILKSNVNQEQFYETMDELLKTISSSSSILGFIEGSYPVHIISPNNSFRNLLLETALHEGQGTIRVGYHFETQGTNISFWFKINGDQKAYFTLPRYLFPEEKIQERNLIEQKEEYLKNVIIPFPINNGSLTTIRLEFDRYLI